MEKFYKKLNKEYEGSVPLWIEESLINIPKEWEQILFSSKSIRELLKIFIKLDNNIQELDEEKHDNLLSPSADNIFEFARLTPIKKIHTVIIGQDPYPNPDHAHGLAFSSKYHKVPNSLKNIYKCLLNFKLINKIPKKSDLTIWAKRGVLLINTALTTTIGNSNSHQELWKNYFN